MIDEKRQNLTRRSSKSVKPAVAVDYLIDNQFIEEISIIIPVPAIYPAAALAKLQSGIPDGANVPRSRPDHQGTRILRLPPPVAA